MIAEIIVTIFRDWLFSKSKKFVYFMYSWDFGTLIILSLLLFSIDPEMGLIMTLAVAFYILTFFGVGRKHTDDDSKTFATSLFKWSLVSIPTMGLFLALLMFAVLGGA